MTEPDVLLSRPKRRFAVVDRDGTIIAEKHYLSRVEDVELLPNAAAGLKRLGDLRLGIVVVSNQSGVGRGYFDRAAVDAVNLRVAALLSEAGVSLDAFYICPHTPDDRCGCRKPQLGLMQRAAADFGFEPADAFVIGDKACDIDLGRNCGAATFLVETGYGREHLSRGWANPDFVARDLSEAAACIEEILSGTRRAANVSCSASLALPEALESSRTEQTVISQVELAEI